MRSSTQIHRSARSWKALAFLCAALVAGSARPSIQESSPESAAASLRVGVFDSRALAIAWAHSAQFKESMKAKVEESEKAKAQGGEEGRAVVERIDAEMQELQHQMHLQGFGTASVANILAVIEKDLPAVAEKAGVDLLVSKWDLAWQRPGAECLDVTEAIVAPLAPDERARTFIAQIQTQAPVPQEELERLRHD